MREFIQEFKREMFFIVLIFVTLQFLILPSTVISLDMKMILTLVGLLFLLVWLGQNYYRYAFREFSKYSEVMIKIDLKNRFFGFFVTPILLYLAISLYMIGVQNMILRQFILIVGIITLFILMVHIRSAYTRVFALNRETRFVYQLVDLILFYIGVTGFVLSGTGDLERVLGATFVAFILLSHQLILHKQGSLYSVLILFLSVALIFVSGLLFVNFSAMVFPLYMTVVYYMVMGLWDVRLAGLMNVTDYLPPILFSLMAFMILLSF